MSRMPLVSKRRREDQEETRKELVKRRKKYKEFTEFENIGYRNDHWHSVFRSIPENIEDLKILLSKYIGSFINGDGGILCFGIRKTGVIYGDNISRREEDCIRLLIDETFKKMHPHVPTDGYRVTFTPVLTSSRYQHNGGKDTAKPHVLEVRVAPGDPFSLYEDHKHEVFLRKGAEPYGPLTPHEIKRHTVQQLRNQLKSQTDMAKLFESPRAKHDREHEKDKENIVTKIKKSSSLSTSTNKSSIESNQSKCSIPSSQQNSHQSSKSPSKSHPTKHNSLPKVATVLGSCKEQPLVLSSGESDHEVPLPPLQPIKKPEQNRCVKRTLPTKPSIQPFQIKLSKATISHTNPPLEEVKKETRVVPMKSVSSSLPPIEKQQSINQTTKVLPSQVKSQKSTQDKPPQPPTRRPVTRAAAQPVKRFSATCILPPPHPAKPVAALPPPPPPPSLFSFPSTTYSGRYHHDYHHTYNHPDPCPRHYGYGGYSSSWESRFPYSHPLSRSYSADYYDFSR